MAAEKIVYWMMVGVLALGAGNSLLRNINASRAVKRSRAEIQSLAMVIGRTTDIFWADDSSKAGAGACPRTVRLNVARARRDAVVVRLDGAQLRRAVELRNRTKMVMVVSE